MSQVTLTATVWAEGEQYVSLCPELGVSSFGGRPEQAVDMLREAVELYLDNTAELGLRSELLPTIQSPIRFSAPLTVAVP
ncbi:MAG: type II toxin-antitoxin system HicB family antitoxin [Hyphomicrobiales bacterium]